MANQAERVSNTSLVIEYEVSKDQELQFRQWQLELRSAVRNFKGYLNTDICTPIKGVQNQWYIIVHFDNSANLTQWLDSDSRHNLIKFGKRNFGSYQYKRLGTGLEKWFSNHRSGQTYSSPSAWKQNFAVLFGLYPTVMIETLLFSQLRLMESWSLAPKIFVNNLVSCSLLTWAVMPFVTRILNFWLRPQQSALKINLTGTLVVFMGYGLMVSIFQFFS